MLAVFCVDLEIFWHILELPLVLARSYSSTTPNIQYITSVGGGGKTFYIRMPYRVVELSRNAKHAMQIGQS